jgi:tetratricopeptide (TPR) repeat protein
MPEATPDAAIAAYERLVVMATAQFDDEALQRYLDNLAYLYDETEQWESAIATKEILFLAYLKKEELLKLAPLRLSIGQNYQALEDGEQASRFYQEAFDLAWANQQYAYANDALTALSELYYSYGQLDAAIAILNEQLKATDYADDHYREMTTYDRLGELYLELQKYPEAIAAFSAGLEIARDLGHREAYFEERVQDAIAASF